MGAESGKSLAVGRWVLGVGRWALGVWLLALGRTGLGSCSFGAVGRWQPAFRSFAAVVLCIVAATASAQLSEAEKLGLRDTLFIANLTPKDLEYSRRPFESPKRLGIIDLSIEKPLEAADRLMEIHGKASLEASSLLGIARFQVLGDPPPPPVRQAVLAPKLPAEVPGPLRKPMVWLLSMLRHANARIDQAMSSLSVDERRTLIEGLPRLAWEQAKYEFVSRPIPTREALLALVAKVDLDKIRITASNLAGEIERLIPVLKAASDKANFRGSLTFHVDGMKVVLCGVEDDVHEERDAVLSVDLGGNDRWVGRHGAGPGYAALSIDLGGDDTYKVGDLSLGAGLIGIGFSYDLGGDDDFDAGSLSLGAGLGGVGVFVKEGGRDRYRGKVGTQGFGMYGVGLMLDTGGNDDYRADLLAQGAGLMDGVGWCIDRSGSDTYRAGGVYLNSPLFADVNYSMAQGYGSGIREDTGGIGGGVGLLTDLGGDDAYIGETYCQAASYWFGLGSLYDVSGHDTYRAYHYAQASAMHLCGAYLFDLGGDDIYAVSFGAAHAIGHDYGVALLLDRAGDDTYSARDSKPGIGNANGVGIFVDADGEDRYIGPPGSANPARGTGSLGLFADLNGPDKYTEGLADGSVRVADTWGYAFDAETRLSKPQTPGAQRPTPKSGTKPMLSEQEMEALYAKATQWAVGTARQDAGLAVDKLIEIGMPALRWMIEKKLAKASRLEQGVFVQTAQALGEAGRRAVAEKVAGAKDEEARVALNVCVDGNFKEAEPHLLQALDRPSLARLAARLAGQLLSRSCVDSLMALCASKDRLAVTYALVALAAIGEPRSLGTGQGFLTIEDLPMRKAAMALVAKFPDQALQSAKFFIEGAEERQARIGVELLGMVGTAEALKECARAMSDARPGVRIQALLALDGRCPSESRTKLLDLRRDPDSRVRAVAQRIDPGR